MWPGRRRLEGTRASGTARGLEKEGSTPNSLEVIAAALVTFFGVRGSSGDNQRSGSKSGSSGNLVYDVFSGN